MKRIIKRVNPYLIISLVFTQLYALNSFAQTISTKGDNSGVLIGKSVSVHYQLNDGILDKIIEVYSDREIPPEKQQKMVNDLLGAFRTMRPKFENSLPLDAASIDFLKIKGDAEIQNILNWELYLTTEGPNCPIIIATQGNAQVVYDISPRTVEKFVKYLQLNNIAIDRIRDELEKLRQSYYDLEKQLKIMIEHNELYNQAYQDLKDGKFNEVRNLLKYDIYGEYKDMAWKAYVYALSLNLTFEHDSAFYHFQKAIANDEKNPTYQLAFSNNLFYLGNPEDAFTSIKLAILKARIFYNNESVELLEYFESAATLAANIEKDDTALIYNNTVMRLDSIHYGTESIQFAKGLNQRGGIMLVLGNIDSAKVCFKRMHKIYGIYYGEYSSYSVSAFTDYGRLYMYYYQYDSAIWYFNRALAIEDSIANDSDLDAGLIKLNIGTCHVANGAGLRVQGNKEKSKLELDRGSEYYEEAYIILKKFDSNFPYHLNDCLYNMRECLLMRTVANFDFKLYENGTKIALRALQICKELGDSDKIAIAYNNIATGYKNLEKCDSARYYIEKALLEFNILHAKVRSQYGKYIDSLIKAEALFQDPGIDQHYYNYWILRYNEISISNLAGQNRKARKGLKVLNSEIAIFSLVTQEDLKEKINKELEFMKAQKKNKLPPCTHSSSSL